jgi:hypothetical protein
MPAQVDRHDPMLPRKVLGLRGEERAVSSPAVHEDKSGLTRTPILKGQLDAVVHNRRHAASPFSLRISLEPSSRQIAPDPDAHLTPIPTSADLIRCSLDLTRCSADLFPCSVA